MIGRCYAKYLLMVQRFTVNTDQSILEKESETVIKVKEKWIETVIKVQKRWLNEIIFHKWLFEWVVILSKCPTS